MLSTPGRLMLERALPEGMRGRDRSWDGRGVRSLFDEIARVAPEKYPAALQRLARLGADLAYSEGGLSFGLEHLRTARAGALARARAEAEAQAVLNAPSGPRDERERALVAIAAKHAPRITDAVYEESLREGNPLAEQVRSGLKGNRSNINSLRGADMLYADHEGRPVPFLVLRNYSEGLSPAEYWAAASGARSGVVGVKLGVATSGWLAKQMLRASHRLKVVARDAPAAAPDAEDRGLEVAVDDPDNEGALLARAAAGLPRDTVLSPENLRALKAAGVARLLVRSPLVGGPPGGGLYGKDAGVRERGVVAPVGEYVGHAAAQALGERATQLSLSSKHSGGVAGSGAGGLSGLDDLLNPPREAPRAAVHARKAGRVGPIIATAGGRAVRVGGEEHAVPLGREPIVPAGTVVEAGDALTDGGADIAAVVEHKGIGEGRRRMMEELRALYEGAGQTAHRRNIEVVARGLVDHVRVTDEFGPHLPGDIVPYSSIEAGWRPREGHVRAAPKDAEGLYLERPVLHYAIGDPVTPSMVRSLVSWKIPYVTAHREPPPFHATFLSGRTASAHDEDPFVRHLGAGAARGTLEAAHRSRSSPEGSTSFVAAMLRPDVFGKKAGAGEGGDHGDDGDGDGDEGRGWF